MGNSNPDVSLAKVGKKLSETEVSERLTVSAFARAAGCDEKQVRRAIDKGLLRKGPDGLLAAGDVSGGWRRINRRTVARIVSDKAESVRKTSDNSGVSDNPLRASALMSETPAEAAERIVRTSSLLSLEDAVKLKENYLGRLKELEYDQKSGAVVPAADVVKLVGAEYAKVRTRLLAIPTEQAPAVHRLKTVPEVRDLLQAVVTEALEELTQDGPSV